MNVNKEMTAAFIGNPNCGKTTLFNAYTGARLKTANWPGVTVEKKEGEIKFRDEQYRLVDLPGVYSLTSYTMEERVSRGYILSDEADVIIDVADASALERNLYLTMQLMELGKPVILALNMMDIVKERGMTIDTEKLSEIIGIPVVPVSARRGDGLDDLINTVADVCSGKVSTAQKSVAAIYTNDIQAKIRSVSECIRKARSDLKNSEWYAIKLLEGDADVKEKLGEKLCNDVSSIADKSYETEIINQKYDYIKSVIDKVLIKKRISADITDNADKILTHNILGIPAFLAIMAIVFILTFTIGDAVKGVLDNLLGMFSECTENFLNELRINETLTALIVDGIIAGVGGVLTFLPNIAILFFALAILEDSGYMARAAYVMDGVMGKMGLSGRAFIPMLLGFGCTVPAVMASRTLEHERDRRRTIFITPFMSCSARLPIYILLSGMFFGKYAPLAAYSMYVIGLCIAIATAVIINKLDKRNSDEGILLIELPEYKLPNAETVFIYVWEKVKDYLSKAGTTIFIASVIMWFIMNFGATGKVDEMSQSFGASIGKVIAPLLAPAGLGMWQIAVALIAGLAAKEVVVSSMSVLFAAGNTTELSLALASYGFGPANAYAMMIFCLLYIPCAAAIAAIHKETGSLKRTVLASCYQLAVAWLMAVIAYHVCLLFMS